MNYAAIVGRVRELAGESISDAQASTIINEVIKMTGLEASVDYPSCSHTSKDMLAHYAKTGLCGVCIHEMNTRLAGLAKNTAAGGTVGGLMLGALAGKAMSDRFVQIIQRHEKCGRCGVGLLEPRRHGCVECRQDRSWLSRMAKRQSAKRRT